MVEGDDGPSKAAHLVAAFDLKSGDLMAWTLGEGEIGIASVRRILTELEETGEILATSAVPLSDDAMVRRAPGRVKPGSVVRAALGASIGRMRILASKSEPAGLPVVTKSDLREVLRSVLMMPEAGN
jgi:hypothetical protein